MEFSRNRHLDLLPFCCVFRFSLSLGIFMLLKRLLRRLLDLGVFTSAGSSVAVIGGGGAGQFPSSEMELPVGEATASCLEHFSATCGFLDSSAVVACGSSSLEIVELHSDVTVRLDSGRSAPGKNDRKIDIGCPSSTFL
jgi:hypothetical protein